MKRMICLSLAVLTCITGIASAEEAGKLTRTYAFQPKAGMSTQFEKAVKSHLNWLKEQNDSWEWSAFQTTTGEDLGTYVFVSHGHSWADLDAAAAHRRAAAQQWREHVSPFIEESRAAIYSLETDFSRLDRIDKPVKYIQATTFYVRPLMTKRFLDVVRPITRAIGSQNSPPPVLTYKHVCGGEPRITFIHTLSDWKDLSKVEKAVEGAIESLGSEAGEVARNISELAVRTESNILMSRPDLSYTPSSEANVGAEN